MVRAMTVGPAYNPKAVTFGTGRVLHSVEKPFSGNGPLPSALALMVVGWGTCGHVWKGPSHELLPGLMFRPFICQVCILWRDV